MELELVVAHVPDRPEPGDEALELKSDVGRPGLVAILQKPVREVARVSLDWVSDLLSPVYDDVTFTNT